MVTGGGERVGDVGEERKGGGAALGGRLSAIVQVGAKQSSGAEERRNERERMGWTEERGQRGQTAEARATTQRRPDLHTDMFTHVIPPASVPLFQWLQAPSTMTNCVFQTPKCVMVNFEFLDPFSLGMSLSVVILIRSPIYYTPPSTSLVHFKCIALRTPSASTVHGNLVWDPTCDHGNGQRSDNLSIEKSSLSLPPRHADRACPLGGEWRS